MMLKYFRLKEKVSNLPIDNQLLNKITPPWTGLAPEEHSKNQILKNFLLYHTKSLKVPFHLRTSIAPAANPPHHGKIYSKNFFRISVL
jgi:hypothetical protein